MKKHEKEVERAAVLRGLTLRQRAFVREKILGSNDKEAALAAGYSLSVAENTKQKIWAKTGLREEYDRLRARFLSAGLAAAASTRIDPFVSHEF